MTFQDVANFRASRRIGGNGFLQELEVVIRDYQCLLLNLLSNCVHFLKRSLIRRHGFLLNRGGGFLACLMHLSKTRSNPSFARGRGSMSRIFEIPSKRKRTADD